MALLHEPFFCIVRNKNLFPFTSRSMNPTKESYGFLNWAYEIFNRELFNGRLPLCIITLPRRKQTVGGYFCRDSWANASHTKLTDEIALNPLLFQHESTERILSTLVHEMCHLQQHHFGHPSRGGYHNKEFSRLMRRVGLIPSDSGQPGGKDTGQSMTHYIEEGGPFQKVCQDIVKTGFTIPWHLVSPKPDTNKDRDLSRKKRESKTKYSCPECAVNVWAKPDVRVSCDDCQRRLVSIAS